MKRIAEIFSLTCAIALFNVASSFTVAQEGSGNPNYSPFTPRTVKPQGNDGSYSTQKLSSTPPAVANKSLAPNDPIEIYLSGELLNEFLKLDGERYSVDKSARFRLSGKMTKANAAGAIQISYVRNSKNRRLRLCATVQEADISPDKGRSIANSTGTSTTFNGNKVELSKLKNVNLSIDFIDSTPQTSLREALKLAENYGNQSLDLDDMYMESARLKRVDGKPSWEFTWTSGSVPHRSVAVYVNPETRRISHVDNDIH